MNTPDKRSLFTRLKEKSPLPIWIFVIVFGPVLPIFVLFVYCIDWYYQMFLRSIRDMASSLGKVSGIIDNTPLIFILGSTAVGKTKLSIALAKMFDGEIISADSMQVYKGLDIITNKVTAEEKQSIPHHMIDIFDTAQEFTVIDFKKRALDTIGELTRRKKIPIIVGGTNYFIEALLWDFLIEEECRDHQNPEIKTNVTEHLSSSEVYEELIKVDPERASKLHPNNIRKIARSLEIFHTTGLTHSSLIKKQQSQPGSSNLSGPIRFPNSLLLWLTAEQDVLDKRISDRVDDMIDKGLVREIETFFENHVKTSAETSDVSCSETDVNVTGNDVKNCETSVNPSERCERKRQSFMSQKITDGSTFEKSKDGPSSKRKKVACGENSLLKSYEEGIFQAIGFKEFHAFLTYSGQCDKERDELLQKSMGKLKQITTRYSKKQVRWVSNRIVNRKPFENSLPVYNLDATDVEEWDRNVLETAKSIVTSFVKGEAIQEEPLLRPEHDKLTRPCSKIHQNKAKSGEESLLEEDDKLVGTSSEIHNIKDNHRRHICEDCDDRLIIGDVAWEAHITSKKHKKMKAGRQRRLETRALAAETDS